MRKSCNGMVLVGAMMAACGGGGNSSNGTSSAQLPSAPKTDAVAVATIGDTYSYRRTTKDLDNPGTVAAVDYSTRVVNNVASNGAISVQYLYDISSVGNPSSYQSSSSIFDIDSSGRMVGSSSFNCQSSPNPAYHLVALYAIAAGANWKYSGLTSASCQAADQISPVSVTFEDSVSAQEQVTVPAGTFNAFKVTRTETDETDARTVTRKRTCWWERELGVEVKCIDNTTAMWKSNGVKFSKEATDELMGYSNQKLARKTDTVIRFVGGWQISFEGIALNQDVTGKCSVSFEADGSTKGCRYSHTGVTFTVTGKVSADGSVMLNLSNGSANQSFTGKLDNIKKTSGALNPSNPSNGTWSLSQDGV